MEFVSRSKNILRRSGEEYFPPSERTLQPPTPGERGNVCILASQRLVEASTRMLL